MVDAHNVLSQDLVVQETSPESLAKAGHTMGYLRVRNLSCHRPSTAKTAFPVAVAIDSKSCCSAGYAEISNGKSSKEST